MAKRKTDPDWEPITRHEWQFDLIWRVYSKLLTTILIAAVVAPVCVLMVAQNDDPKSRTFTTLVGLAGVIACVGAVGYCVYEWPWKPVTVCPAGLKFTKAGEQRQYTWKEIATVHRTARAFFMNGQRDHFRSVAFTDLLFTDKSAVRLLPGLAGYDRLAQSVQEATAQAMLPEAFADLDEGACEFGPIDVTPKGIQYGSKLFT